MSKDRPAGWPKYLNEGGRKRMERDARRYLWSYGVTAKKAPALWAAALQWASDIANSYSYRQQWPTGPELAAYFLLLLTREFTQTFTVQRLPNPVRRPHDLPPAAGPPVPRLALFDLTETGHDD